MDEMKGFASRAKIMSLLRMKGVDQSKINILPKKAEFVEIGDTILKFKFMRYEYEYNYFIGVIRYKDKDFGPWTKWHAFG